MFEHSIYEPEPVAEPLHEGDLFYHYELPNWQPGPRIYKILGISAVANLVVFFIFTATPVLTMKGCDSPLVGSVCQVLDTLYVGSTIFGTQRDYVDAVYDKTKIGDADVTFVDVTSDTPPLDYPEGYFQIANPEQYAALQAALDNPDPTTASSSLPGIPPGITLTTPEQGNSLLNTKQRLPKANPTGGFEGDLPTSFGGNTVASTGGHGRGKNNSGKTPDATPSPSPSPEPSPITSDPLKDQINKRPLTDLADQVVTQWATKQVDLNQNFTITMNGVITPDGKLDINKSKFVNESGDPKMINVGKEAFQALGATGFLGYLKNAGIDQVTATLTQDDQNLTVTITSVQKSVERARTVSSLVSSFIVFGKVKYSEPSDEKTLLDAAKSGNDGKTYTLNFALPKPVAQEMITRKLQEAQAKKGQPQPSSESNTKPNNNTALK
jgi:hypothetical protein